MIAEKQFGTGALEQPDDNRNLVFEDHLKVLGAPTIDWEKGYDVRNDLGGHIFIKNQRQSSSCVGQAASYEVWKQQVFEMMERYQLTLSDLYKTRGADIEDVSARAIYSQIFLPGGGAYIQKAMKLVIDWGSLFEGAAPSTKSDDTVPEEFMRDKSWKNTQMDDLAKVLQGKEYRIIKSQDNIDMFAQALSMNKGVVGGLKGQNGRNWLTEFPLPPQNLQAVDWGHALWFGAYGLTKDGKKFIATPNSWGNMAFNQRHVWKPGDAPGAGWQKITEDYFTEEAGKYMFDPWTYTDKLNPNQNDMKKTIKGDLRDEIYMIGDDGLLCHIANGQSFEKGVETGLWGDWETVDTKPQAEVDALPKGNPISFLIK